MKFALLFAIYFAVVSANIQEECGVQPLVKSGRIVGGKDAEIGEWPWQVLISQKSNSIIFCGGVLISENVVISTASCQCSLLQPNESVLAVFGEHDVSKTAEKKNIITIIVKKIFYHTEYNNFTLQNDIALLHLDTPVMFDKHIVPICMPLDDGKNYTGQIATATGWGRLRYGGKLPTVLQKVEVPVIESKACEEMYNKKGHNTKKIFPSLMCAGFEEGGKYACQGDSGSPLVLQRSDKRWGLIGVVSHGINCAAPLLPGIYTRTTHYLTWIEHLSNMLQDQHKKEHFK